MKSVLRTLIWVAAISLLAAWLISQSEAKEDGRIKLKARLRKPDIVETIWIGYNNWNYVMRNTGQYFYNYNGAEPSGGNSAGSEFPRGTGRTLVYAAGFYFATIKDGIKVCSEVEYSSEYQPGRIVNSNVPFSSLQAENPAAAPNKVYFINKYNQGEGDDSASVADWTSWPGQRTASNQPSLIADAQTWVVFNDLDTTRSQEKSGTSPNPGLGVEVVLESFVFDEPLLSDVVFLKFTITNKTNVDYTDSYFGIYADSDVNNSFNDIVGSDSILGIGFAYDSEDEPFPAAVGFDFFQGPIADTSEILIDAYLKFSGNTHRLYYNSSGNNYEQKLLNGDSVWLGAISTASYDHGTDPHANNERYNLLAGLNRSGIAKTDNGRGYKYIFPGNPLTQQGSPDVASERDGNDWRILNSTGPFTLRSGDNQEIWAGVIGGEGANRLAAFAKMKQTDLYAQMVLSSGFARPEPPEVPKIAVAGMDKAVFISWGNAAEYTVDEFGQKAGITTPLYTADYVMYDFQGYRVYKSLTGLEGSYEKIAEFDKIDGKRVEITVYVDERGLLRIEPVEIGTDNGLKYVYVDREVVNGRKYYYAVCSYDAQPYIGYTGSAAASPDGAAIASPVGLPITLESSKMANAVAVVPDKDRPGVEGVEVSAVEHSAGYSDASLEVNVIDPSKITGNAYTIEFFQIPGSQGGDTLQGLTPNIMAYRIFREGILIPFSNKADDPSTYRDVNRNGIYDGGDQEVDDRYFSTIIASKDEDEKDELFSIVDGVLIKVYGPPVGYFKSVTYTPGPQFTSIGFTQAWFRGAWNGNRLTIPEFNTWGLSSPSGIFSPNSDLVGGVFRNANGSFASTEIEAETVTTANKDFEIQFSRDSTKWSYAYCTNGGTLGLVNYLRVPFKVFEIDPSDGVTVARQINTTLRNSHYDTGGPNALWSLESIGLSAIAADDGFGPERRSTMGFDTSSYDLSALTGHFGVMPFNGRPLEPNVTLYGIGTANYAAWFPTYRDNEDDNSAEGRFDGIAYRDFIRTQMGYDSMADDYAIDMVTRGLQGLIYRNIPDEGILTARVYHLITPNDRYTFTTKALTKAENKTIRRSLKDIKVVPNPYYGQAYRDQVLQGEKLLKFMNLPDVVTIKVFTVSGDLVKIIQHNATSNNERLDTEPYTKGEPESGYTGMEIWDLRNERGRFIASGMYIALIEVPKIGKTTVKFAVIQQEE
ncbi:hypothetical protein K1X84_07045 [bacterium]|nr:hypothetical protein [bacterium]